MSVVVVGASAGGLTVAEALRGRGYTGRIQLVGQEHHLPYDRPPLSKQILTGAWPAERTLLRQREQLDGLDMDLLLGRRAVQLDAAVREVSLDDGRRLPYEHLVIATGLTPRRLPAQPDLPGLHTFRTLDDALALRRDLTAARRLAVVGAGVLGCEIAAAARTLGVSVTLLDPAPTPMATQLGGELGGVIAALHRAHDVDLRTDTPVAGLFETGGKAGGVKLADGQRVAADVVVVAAGSVPATGWLTGSGLTLDDGIVCDVHCAAAPGVYAVGDVARLPGGRVESRTSAAEQALTVAANILGDRRAHSSIPYFWTDQYDVKLQIHGTIRPRSRIRWIDGIPGDQRFAALAVTDGVITAVVGWNHPRAVLRARRQIGEPCRG
ncbi:NAD(P)/FAD-dependent oxidoreductase [Nonomuraea endophytica]|uniref:NAD(P)/FAD-dependent oxidoreductase n=1 Tax=Nonomuraea endophytica TaxID=714136 RepID=UPI0037C9E467